MVAATQKILLQAMGTFCHVSVVAFQNLHDTHEPQGGKGLGKIVKMLLCDALYIVRR